MPRALDGVRVLDLTWVGAGPFLTKPLADHGGEVIKVESRTRTDPIRWMRPFRDGIAGVNRSGYFANRTSSKKSICLDLKHPRGHSIAVELIRRSDTFAHNFAPGAVDRLELSYEQVRGIREDIIYIEMPMQGLTGPSHSFKGFGLTIGAASGFLGASGWPDRKPVGTGTNYPDHVPNPLHAAIAVLAALHNRRRTGQGEHIELSQLESTVNVLGSHLVLGQLNPAMSPRLGNHDPLAAPHGVYPCNRAEDWCAITVFDDANFDTLRRVLGPSELDQPRYCTAHRRRQLAKELDDHLGAATRAWDKHDLAAALVAEGVPAGPVLSAPELLADPQLQQRGHWTVLDHPEMGPSVYDNIPYTLSRTPGALRTSAPLLGADTVAVLTDVLGMEPTEIESLQAEGIVG